EMFFLAIEEQLDGPAGFLREPRADEALRVGTELAAEAAAHVLRDDADVRAWNLQALREAVLRAVDALRGDPRRELVAVPLADAAVRLHAHVRDDVRRIRLFDDVRGGFEAGLDVAVLLDVALALIADGVHHDAVEDLRRVAGHRLLDVRDVLEHVISDLDEARRVFGLLFRVGGDGRDRIALIERLRGRLIFPDERRAHARRGFRRAHVDRHDLRVRIRRADDLAVDHPGPVDVEAVLRAPGDLVRTVEALHPRAEDGGLGRP